MKKLCLFVILLQASFLSYSQMVARAEIKERIEGICDIKNVYTLFPMFEGQVEAICSVQDSTIENKLNNEVQFLKDKQEYKDKGMVSIIINCKGEVVQCKTDNKTESSILDAEILEVFKILTIWKAGKLKGKNVDSLRLWSFEIKNGKIKIN